MPCPPAAASSLCGSVSSRATEPWDGGSLTRACMRRCGCVGRGNHLTLIAAANCYQRPIRVWSTAPGDDWWLQIEPKHYKVSTLLALRLVLQSRMVCGMVASGHGAPPFDCGRARRGGSLPVRCPLVNACILCAPLAGLVTQHPTLRVGAPVRAALFIGHGTQGPTAHDDSALALWCLPARTDRLKRTRVERSW
jgi:hypothetical protein